MKNKKILFIGVVSLFVVILGLVLWFMLSLTSVSNKSEDVTFTIEKGRSTKQVIKDLKSAGLIKSEIFAYLYVKLNSDIIIQAGNYILNKNMSTVEILETFDAGDVLKDSVTITFVEGVRLTKFISKIAITFNWNEEELLKKINEKEYVKNLVDKYWFLEDEILDNDIYYALEGYLFPNTYEFDKNVTFEEVITKMLNQTDKVLTKYKDQIKEIKYSVHDIMTMASIAEKEALSYEDRTKVSQVIYKRLNMNMSLGMDVTSYYGVQKDMTEVITKKDLNDNNPYNTRLSTFKGLPIGPICNPSESSIKAVLNPSDTNYVYFFADITTGKVYFTADYKEFLTFEEIYG